MHACKVVMHACAPEGMLTPKVQASLPACQVREKQEMVGCKCTEKKPDKLRKWLSDVLRRIPVIQGPSEGAVPCYYIIDHHHLSLALMAAGIEVKPSCAGKLFPKAWGAAKAAAFLAESSVTVVIVDKLRFISN